MTCHRCKGFLHSRIVEHPDIMETHCLSCGWYHNPPYAETIREPYWRKAKRPCRNCKQDAILGKSYCQAHLDYMVNYKRTRKVAG